MSVNQQVEWALREAEVRIMQAVQNPGDGWNEVCDEDGNENVPDSAREVLVFLCGDRPLSAERPSSAGHGLRLGWFDDEKRFWRVGGTANAFVTHWREVPAPPELTQEAHDNV